MDVTTEGILLKKGAEASLFLVDWNSRKVVVKIRIPKRYRPKELDERIRNYRTVHESLFMHEAKSVGVPTPLIYMVSVSDASIIMEYVEGCQVKLMLNESQQERRQEICKKIGELIAKLHRQDIIHGDLTTSNMIINPEGKIVLVDFGLAEKNCEVEAKGVDLHLMKRALQSTHYQFWEECYKNVLCGYSSVLGIETAENVSEKIREIERRGRYVEERKQ